MNSFLISTAVIFLVAGGVSFAYRVYAALGNRSWYCATPRRGVKCRWR